MAVMGVSRKVLPERFIQARRHILNVQTPSYGLGSRDIQVQSNHSTLGTTSSWVVLEGALSENDSKTDGGIYQGPAAIGSEIQYTGHPTAVHSSPRA